MGSRVGSAERPKKSALRNKGLSNESDQMIIFREVSNLTNQDAKAWTQTAQQMIQLADPDSPDLHTLSETS
jgi:endonuclease/exonuclease/phosphatase (EEP) superfamily protein YafD